MNMCNSISNYFARILSVCKTNKQKAEDEPIEEIVKTTTTVVTAESTTECGDVAQKTQEITELVDSSVQEIQDPNDIIIETETVQSIPKKTYSEVLKQAPIIKQQNQAIFTNTKENNQNETNKRNYPPRPELQNGYNTGRGRNRRNQSHTEAHERKSDYNRGEYENRARAGRSNRSRGRNRKGTTRGQHTNINSSANRGYHLPRGRGRGSKNERPFRARGRGYRGRGDFVHGGINKSNSFRSSSGIFSYSNAFIKTKDENNNNQLQNGTNKGHPIIFNYYIVKNYVRKDEIEDDATSEIIKMGSNKHFL